MGIEKRRIALVGLLALVLTVGAAGLHAHHDATSADADCTACALAQTPSTIALESVAVAETNDEATAARDERASRLSDLSHARADTERGPPSHG
jgi:hypothetical protein